MATTRKEVFLRAEPVTEFMHLNVLTERQVYVDGELWTFGKHRVAVECGADLSLLPKAAQAPVKALADQLWTPDVKAAWAEHKAANRG